MRLERSLRALGKRLRREGLWGRLSHSVAILVLLLGEITCRWGLDD